MPKRTILIFDDRSGGGETLPEIVAPEGATVVYSSRVLDAIRVLKSEPVRVVLANDEMPAPEREAFVSLVEMVRPGTRVLFAGIGGNGRPSLTLDAREFGGFVAESLVAEGRMSVELREFKEFFFSFAERMLQIFGATSGYFANRDHVVAWLAHKTALKLGLTTDLVEDVRAAALLRDIGMLSIKKQLLQERRRFRGGDLISLKKHPLNSVQILKQIRFPWNVDAIILQHHENYDGSGYPYGLRGREIAVGARILHVADSFVAMTTTRPHRRARSYEEARSEVRAHAGTQFDPEVVDTFLAVIDEERMGVEARRTIVVLELTPSIASTVRLAVDQEAVEIVPLQTFSALMRQLRRSLPELVIADVALLTQDNLIAFFNALHEVPHLGECHFVFVLTDPAYPRQFTGDNVSYLQMPIDLRDLTAAIDRAMAVGEDEADIPVEVEEGGQGGLSGELEDFGLADIVQILKIGLKTAKVELRRMDSHGAIYLDDGNIVGAEVGELRGEDAFYELMGWRHGGFNIYYGVHPDRRTIRSETMYLLLEATKRLDEARRDSGAGVGGD
jgi:HD-GYP domain-containing protein (c-di-GMP phosphodiesterase class II)